MAKVTIHYSVQNGGDGSAYPAWFESEELAELDQELMDERWGESCTGSITIKGDNIEIEEDIISKEQFFANLVFSDDSHDEVIEDVEAFIRAFRHMDLSKYKASFKKGVVKVKYGTLKLDDIYFGGRKKDFERRLDLLTTGS